MNAVVVRPAASPGEWAAVAELMRAYVDSLPFELDFQDFDRELAELAREYGPPDGCALLAWLDGTPVGVAGVRRIDHGVAELKRMYLRPAARGHGLGRRLAEAAVDAARRLGYRSVRLDTVTDTMPEANALYGSLGFRDIPPYRHNPLPAARFLELRLD